MAYCNECGHQLEAGAAFCGECGTPVKGGAENANASVPNTPPAPKKPMSKKTKTLLIAGVAAIVLLFGVHKTFEAVFSKDRLIDHFEQALYENNAEEVIDLINTNDKNMEIDENSIKGFMQFFEENPDQVTAVVQSLQSQSNMLDEDEGSADYRNNPMINLEQNGKFLFYDKYQLMVPSVYLSLQTNYADTLLFVDGKEVGQSDSPDYQSTFGPFLPGYHTVKATLKSDYLELNQEEEVFINGSDSKLNVELYIDADEVTFYLPNDGSAEGTVKLFVNGKDVGVNLLENPTFGPVTLDGSMSYYVEAELPWGTVKTEEAVLDDDDIEISYLNDDLKNTLMDTVHNYIKQWTYAVTNADTSQMTTAADAMKDRILDDANQDKESDYASTVKYISSTFDLESISVYYNDGTWSADISAKNNMLEDSYYVGDEAELTESNDERYYELVFDSEAGTWLVTDEEYLWYFSGDNVKEYVVEEPEEYTSVWATAGEEESTDETANADDEESTDEAADAGDEENSEG